MIVSLLFNEGHNGQTKDLKVKVRVKVGWIVLPSWAPLEHFICIAIESLTGIQMSAHILNEKVIKIVNNMMA